MSVSFWKHCLYSWTYFYIYYKIHKIPIIQASLPTTASVFPTTGTTIYNSSSTLLCWNCCGPLNNKWWKHNLLISISHQVAYNESQDSSGYNLSRTVSWLSAPERQSQYNWQTSTRIGITLAIWPPAGQLFFSYKKKLYSKQNFE